MELCFLCLPKKLLRPYVPLWLSLAGRFILGVAFDAGEHRLCEFLLILSVSLRFGLSLFDC